MKLPALQKSSVAELKTGLRRQDPWANNQNSFFPECALLSPFWPWTHWGMC